MRFKRRSIRRDNSKGKWLDNMNRWNLITCNKTINSKMNNKTRK